MNLRYDMLNIESLLQRFKMVDDVSNSEIEGNVQLRAGIAHFCQALKQEIHVSEIRVRKSGISVEKNDQLSFLGQSNLLCLIESWILMGAKGT